MTQPAPAAPGPTLVSDPPRPQPLAPASPKSLGETGLSADNVTALLLKTLYTGELSGREIAEQMGLPYGILEDLIAQARAEQLMEVRSASGTGTAGYRYALTDRGRERAQQLFETSGYVGVAPVPLAQYVRYVEASAAQDRTVDQETVAHAFNHLILEDRMLGQLGPAMSARRAMFLHGPPGNGKSAMGSAMGRALGDPVYMPHALDVDGHVVTLFDPVTHQPEPAPEQSQLIRAATETDGRWVRIRRPVIMVGGELTLDQLDLKFNQLSRFYEAPVQLKATGGVLLVDDFGRQQVPANALLNRWIVPLESRVDFLTLATGRKFDVPFDVFVVFATNLEPRTLADEAFLRRIPYKVQATNPSLEQFTAIFKLNCEERNLSFDPKLVDHLCREYYEGRGLEIRACHPRDLLEQVITLCRYRKQPLQVSVDLLEEACQTYFLDAPVGGTQAAVE